MGSTIYQIPAREQPLPERVLLRHGWMSGVLMTVFCSALAALSLWLMASGRGTLAFFALFAIAPGLWLGYRQIRTGGAYVLLDADGFSLADYGVISRWGWRDVTSFRVGDVKGQSGIWTSLAGSVSGGDIFIDPERYPPQSLADLMNAFRTRALAQP